MRRARTPKVRLTISVSRELRDRCKARAAEMGMSLSRFSAQTLDIALWSVANKRAQWQDALRGAAELRGEIRRRRGVQPDCVDLIRQMREERDDQIAGER